MQSERKNDQFEAMVHLILLIRTLRIGEYDRLDRVPLDFR